MQLQNILSLTKSEFTSFRQKPAYLVYIQSYLLQPMSGFGLAKEMQIQLLIDISNAMLQNRQYSLSQHEIELTKIKQLKHLQLINDLGEQPNTQANQLTPLVAQAQELSPNLTKTVQIKIYCQLIISAISQNHTFNAQQYLSQLLSLVKEQSDIEKVNYFLFGVTSLLKLKDYEAESNKEYKYDLSTQALLCYILTFIKPQLAKHYSSKFNALYLEVETNHACSQLLQAAYKCLNSTHNHFFLQDLLQTLIQQELALRTKNCLENSTLEKIIQKVDKVIIQKRAGNRKLIQTLNLLKQTQKYPFFKLMIKNLSQTNLLKKVFQEKNLQTPKKQAQNYLRLYEKMQENYGLGDIIKFKRCEVGMSILKYNFRNNEVGWRYVKIGEDGIFWGKEADKCAFKYSWEMVQGLVYGKVTQNIINKCKYISSENIFSLILKERSLDFICQSQEETLTWIQGIAYILNKFWSHTKWKSQQKRLVFPKGNIYWKRLFMKLSIEAPPLLNKSSGILYKESLVKCKLKERRSQSRNSKR